MNVDFAKELYFRELDRRAALDAAPTMRIAALASLAAIFSFYASHYDPAGAFLPRLFVLFAAGALCFGSLAAIWILRAYLGFEWQYLANASKLLEHFNLLEAAEGEGKTGPRTATQLFESRLVDMLVAAAAHNARNNNARSTLLYYSGIYLAIAVICTMLAGAPVLSQALMRWPIF